MTEICHMFNISRQGFYKFKHRRIAEKLQSEVIVQRVKETRRQLARSGGRKLYHMLHNDLRRLPIKIGRDRFFGILRENGLLVKPTRGYVVTTQSWHRFRVYTNLIKDRVVSRANEVFVADITYIRVRGGFSFLFLVTDVYSRKIVGYCLSESLRAEGAVKAMKMALRQVPDAKGSIHHSNRGFQYCCDEYVKLLRSHGIEISMGEAGNPYENAIAERVNGILKTEFSLNATFINRDQAEQAVIEAISLYNDLRPHLSIGYMTPSEKYAA